MSIVPMSPWLALPAAILLNSFYARIHAPTMGNTLGAGCVLIASMLTSSAAAGRPVIHELLITVFLLLTSPVTTMLLMRAAVFRSETGRDRQGKEAS